MPKLDEDELPVPDMLSVHFDVQRDAREGHLTTIEPRLRALDALLEDPDVRELLLHGDRRPVIEGPVGLREHTCSVNELAASAVLARSRGDPDAALRRVEQSLEVLSTLRGRGDHAPFIQCACCCTAEQDMEFLGRYPGWSSERAWKLLAPLLRALIEDQEECLDSSRGLVRRSEAVWAMDREGSIAPGTALLGVRGGESRVERSIATERVLHLALAADACWGDHGRWPASTSELASRLAADELECSLVPEPLDLAPDGPNLRVGMIHSTRPPNEHGTTWRLVR